MAIIDPTEIHMIMDIERQATSTEDHLPQQVNLQVLKNLRILNPRLLIVSTIL